MKTQKLYMGNVDDSRFVWDNSLPWKDQILPLSKEAMDEIKGLMWTKNREDPYPDLRQSLLNEGFAHFRKEILAMKEDRLEKGSGFALLDINGDDFNRDQMTTVLIAASMVLGDELYSQGPGKLFVKEVKDRGLTYDDSGKARYSDTNRGWNLHTDGAEYPAPAPVILGLLCLHQAKSGGESLLVSAYSIHNQLLKNHPEELERLYDNFHWDRRGELGPNGEKTFEKPVFMYDSAQGIFGLTCEYLRRYIDDGYKNVGKPLDTISKKALDAMDKYITDGSPLLVYGRIEPGQILFSNNYTTIHGRTDFIDYPEPEKKRVAERTWIAKGIRTTKDIQTYH